MKKLCLFLASLAIGIGLFFWILKIVGWQEIKDSLRIFTVWEGFIIVFLTLVIALVNNWDYQGNIWHVSPTLVRVIHDIGIILLHRGQRKHLDNSLNNGNNHPEVTGYGYGLSYELSLSVEDSIQGISRLFYNG